MGIDGCAAAGGAAAGAGTCAGGVLGALVCAAGGGEDPQPATVHAQTSTIDARSARALDMARS